MIGIQVPAVRLRCVSPVRLLLHTRTRPQRPSRQPGRAFVMSGERVIPVVLFHVTDLLAPLCAQPENLAIVDAAYAKPGSAAGRLMRDQLCSRCPAASQCLSEAMARGEWGIWGGTTPNLRTRHHGARPKTGPVRVVAR